MKKTKMSGYVISAKQSIQQQQKRGLAARSQSQRRRNRKLTKKQETLEQIIHKEFMMDPDFEETLIKSVRVWLQQQRGIELWTQDFRQKEIYLSKTKLLKNLEAKK